MPEDIRPARGKIFVQPDEFPDEIRGIILPEEYKERPEYRAWRGTVVEVGPARWDGKRWVVTDVTVGDRILYDRTFCSQLLDTDLTIIDENDVKLKGPDVERCSFVPRGGIRADGHRVGEIPKEGLAMHRAREAQERKKRGGK